jgi:hypothetical protein
MRLNEFMSIEEGTKCWKGYERKGFKTMFGKRVPNCVKRESQYLVVDKFNQPIKLFDNEQKAVAYFKENFQLLDSCEYHDHDTVDEDLKAWFGKGKKGGAGGGGWDRYDSKGKRLGKCGDRKPGEGKPKCLSKAKAASLRSKGGKKAIAQTVARKRRKDSNPERSGKAKNVSNKYKK